MLAPLAFPNRCPLADARQVFEGDPTPGAFCLLNNPLGDHVINVFRKAGLFAAALLEQAAGRPRALLLEPLAYLAMALPQTVEVSAREGLALRRA